MKKLNAYIPFDEYQYVGGPSSFLRNLHYFIETNTYMSCDSFNKAKAIFFPISYSIASLTIGKIMGKQIIQRLDGLYYYPRHGKEYRRLNLYAKDIYLYFADYVVFQSKYSRDQWFSMYGEKASSKYQIVLNGADRAIFYPSTRKEKHRKVKFVTSGNIRSRDMIEPIIKALDYLTSKYKFELNIVGPISDDSLRKYINRKYVIHHETKTLEGVANLLRESDVFLYSQLNPPCPNSVIEAVSCGLPVVGFDSGAMGELLPFSKDLLAKVSDDVFQEYKNVDHQKLAEKIELVIEKFSKYKKIALKNSNLYPFDECGEKYIEILNNHSGINNNFFDNILTGSTGFAKHILHKYINLS